MKKALAEITGPYRLIQVIWLTTQFPEYEWDIIVKYVNGKDESVEQMIEDCRKSGRFSRIIKHKDSIQNDSFFHKLKKFMIWIFAPLFMGKEYYKRIIENDVETFNYDLLCVGNSFSELGCAMMHYAKKIPTFVLEDGVWEYCHSLIKYGILTDTVGFILFKLGIINYNARKGFNLNKNCIKYVTLPENNNDTNFKEIRVMFDNSVNNSEYYDIIKNVYSIDDEKFDLILFTSVDLGNRYKNIELKELIVRWMEKYYPGKKILIKKHPRDLYDYQSSICTFVCKYNLIPGELLIPFFKDVNMLFMYPSTLLMNSSLVGCNYKIIKIPTNMVGERYEHNFNSVLEYLQEPKENVVIANLEDFVD